MNETPSTDDRARPERPGLMHRDISVAGAVGCAAVAVLLLGSPGPGGCGASLFMVGAAGLAAKDAWRKKRRFWGLAVGSAVAAVAIILGVLLLVLLQMPRGHGELREVARCGSNLNAISKAVQIYMKEHDGQAPPSLQPLIDNGQLRREEHRCPNAETGWGYFIYFPGLAGPEGSAIIACDLEGNHWRHRNILLQGGEVMTANTEQVFQAELAKPINAAFAAALRKFEGKQEASP